ncbi:MAG: endonuclease III domain-containing protein [Actinomycetota bacterium]
MLTVLSQNTSDANSGRAFEGLKQRFPTWDEVAGAPVEELADAIRAGGIAEVKSRRIKQILHEIEAREGSIDLSRLRRVEDVDATDYLLSLPGVGAKTAACVLVFSMGRDAFPIDTHVHRILRRLGWIEDKTSADQAHRVIGPRIPPEIRYDLHMAFIRHGREICKPRNPRCSVCVLFDLCEAGPAFVASGEAR